MANVVSTVARVVIPARLPIIATAAGVGHVAVVVVLPGASWTRWKCACAWSDIPAHRWGGGGSGGSG